MFGSTTYGRAITGCSSAPANAPGGFPSCLASLSDMFSLFCLLNCENFSYVLIEINPASDTMTSYQRNNSVRS